MTQRKWTELKDAALLARIAGGDLVAIEAKYHPDLQNTETNTYRGALRATSSPVTNDDSIYLTALVYAEI
jgi:hypothetical protein